MNEIGRRITDKLIEIHGSNDFSIAFLPYKRSMWNSMESVFEECKASGIDAHCYPIPYICLKENKQIDYIANDYDLFEEAEPIERLHHADYIAIHYQYEDHNKVTNMLPQYFTKALKERYGAKIVFHPYGIGMGERHFALQPGCRYVDYAFLESEDQAERFIAGWLTQGVDFNGRCFGYGSAKLDAMGKLPKDVPVIWEEIIEGRSVTLVLNSLGPFLSDPFGHIEQYEAHIMKELDEGHAVIFRPHPLLRTTIKSMRPDTLQRYNAFIEGLRIKDHVIVDESEYLERALGIADRMICDMSSVVAMWRCTGKPYEVLP